MTRQLLILLIILTSALSLTNARAEEIKIKSFSILMEPMTVPMQRKDLNGNICALIKVILPSPQAVFEGNVIGDCQYKTAEYWCYLSPGSKFLNIKYPGCEPLMIKFTDLIGQGVQSKTIYELTLSVPFNGAEQSLPIYTIEIKVCSTEKNKILGKILSVPIDSLKAFRINSSNMIISAFEPATNVVSGEYTFNLGAVVGDRFDITAPGYEKATVTFDNPNSNKFNITLQPAKTNIQFVVKDSVSKDSLTGACVTKNRTEVSSGFFSNKWDNQQERKYTGEKKITDENGFTPIFYGWKITDTFYCSLAGYKCFKGNITGSQYYNSSSFCTYTIELEPYSIEEDSEIKIYIGGMGINDKGKVNVTNSRTMELFTMSQKANENFHVTRVKLGDELIFSRKGYRTISVKFINSIPDRIDISPIKGNKDDFQYLQF